MSRKSEGSTRGGGEFVRVLPSLIPLILKVGTTYLRFKKEAQRAARIFMKELRAQGIDKHTAKAMTELYLESSRILRTFDYSEFMNRAEYNEIDDNNTFRNEKKSPRSYCLEIIRYSCLHAVPFVKSGRKLYAF